MTAFSLAHLAVPGLPPGEGGIDLRRILRHMPPGIPVALEVPMTTLATAEAVGLLAGCPMTEPHFLV